jgi:hypothetical protein
MDALTFTKASTDSKLDGTALYLLDPSTVKVISLEFVPCAAAQWEAADKVPEAKYCTALDCGGRIHYVYEPPEVVRQQILTAKSATPIRGMR